MQVGDIVNIKFWEEVLKTENSEKTIDTREDYGEINVYFEDYENRVFTER